MHEVKKYAVTAERLRELGIVEQTQPGDFAFPNRCHGLLTVSDELLAIYRAKGFSLMTLCLGLRAPWIRFHPETGKPLAIVGLKNPRSRGDDDSTVRDYLMQIPSCFRNGTPYEDCTFTYDFMIGLPHAPDRIAWFTDKAQKMSAQLEALLAKGRFTTECGCGDLEPVMVKRWEVGRDRTLPSFKLKASRSCYLDRTPDCADRMSKGWEPAGALHFEIPSSDLIKLFGMNYSERGFLNENIELSPRLPRGYGYTHGSPEGDDSTPYVELPSGSRFGAGDDD